jgi:hypothetical protein
LARVGEIDLNKPRMRWVAEAFIALSVSPRGFRASQLANQVKSLSQQSATEYRPLRAVYDLKKLRGKDIVRRIGKTRRYEVIPKGLRAFTATIVLRNKAITPLLAAAQELQPARHGKNPRPLGPHYEALRIAMQGVFHELGTGRARVWLRLRFLVGQAIVLRPLSRVLAPYTEACRRRLATTSRISSYL